MQARDLAHERQAKPGAALAGLRTCQRIEPLEDALERVIGHAAATVFDHQLPASIVQPRPQAHMAVLRRKRDGVFEQIDQCLSQQKTIAKYVVTA